MSGKDSGKKLSDAIDDVINKDDTDSSVTETGATPTQKQDALGDTMSRSEMIKLINDKRAELQKATNDYNTLMDDHQKIVANASKIEDLKQKVFKIHKDSSDPSKGFDYFYINKYGYKRDLKNVTNERDIPVSCKGVATGTESTIVDLSTDENKTRKETYAHLIKPDVNGFKPGVSIDLSEQGATCEYENKIIKYGDLFAYITPGGHYRPFNADTTLEDLSKYSGCPKKEEVTTIDSTQPDEKLKYTFLKTKKLTTYITTDKSCEGDIEESDLSVKKKELEEKIYKLYDEIKDLMIKMKKDVSETNRRTGESMKGNLGRLQDNQDEVMKLRKDIETGKERQSYFDVYKRYINVYLVIGVLLLFAIVSMILYFLGIGDVSFSDYFNSAKNKVSGLMERKEGTPENKEEDDDDDEGEGDTEEKEEEDKGDDEGDAEEKEDEDEEKDENVDKDK